MANVRVFPRRGEFEPWISKRQLAQHWGCSTRTIERLVREGLPSRPPEQSANGRRMFHLSRCERWLEQRDREAS